MPTAHVYYIVSTKFAFFEWSDAYNVWQKFTWNLKEGIMQRGNTDIVLTQYTRLNYQTKGRNWYFHRQILIQTLIAECVNVRANCTKLKWNRTHFRKLPNSKNRSNYIYCLDICFILISTRINLRIIKIFKVDRETRGVRAQRIASRTILHSFVEMRLL